MDGHVMLLCIVIVAQIYLATDEVKSLLDDKDVVGHLHTLSTNAISVISTSLTALCTARLRLIRHSLERVEKSLQMVTVDHNHRGRPRWTINFRVRGCLIIAIAMFGYLKYGQLQMQSGQEKNAYTTVVVAVLCTTSMAGNYYVTVMFVEHVFFAKRVLHRLNVQIMDTLGSVSASFLAGFTMSSARLAYLDICDDCATVTRMFQTQLFINIVGNVFGVTFMMLSAFNTLMSDGANTIRITLYFLYDSLVRTLQMYFIIDACHTTVEQANSINITFQKKINEYHQVNFIKRKIQLFILEMLDHKIEFIIYGFICLDFEMFVSIMGTIATYLLILVQLGSSPNALEKTFNISTISTTTAMYSTKAPSVVTKS